MKYIAFDGYFDVEVRRGGKTKVLTALSNEILPAVARGKLRDPDLDWALPIACPVCAEQLLSGNHLLNIILPAAVSAILEQHDAEEAASLAVGAAFVSAGIPGCKPPAKKVAQLAFDMIQCQPV